MELRRVLAGAALAALVAALAIAASARPFLVRGAADRMSSFMPLLVRLVVDGLADEPDALQPRVRALTRGSDLRLTVIRGDGVVVADSERTLEQLALMDNHAGRPEVRLALERGRGESTRRSATTRLEYVYLARRVTDAEGRLFVVRLAQPLHQLELPTRGLALRLLAILLAAAVLGGAAGRLLERRLYRPLRRLGGRLSALAGEAGATAPLVSDAERVDSLAAGLDRVVERLKRRLDESDADRSRLQEILESMSDGVLVADREHQVELLNRSFRALFAVREADPRKTVLELARSPALVRFMDRLDEAGDIRIERIGSEAGRTLELHGRRLGGGRTVVVAHDLTDQLRLDETRRDLVANVSHELRTPLTAIRGYAENLRDGALGDPATGARFVERILVQSGRLEALLEDLLALSRLERQEERPATGEPVALGALAEQAVETVRTLADERRVRLRLEAEQLPAIEGSNEALERLLLNLLENAIKYNREGGEVTVGLRRRAGEVVVEVTDTGIGIPQRDLPRIFERFYRVDGGRSRDEGGTGLGLAIVKHAAQLHGGRVEVESELGRGSTFRVLLPLPTA